MSSSNVATLVSHQPQLLWLLSNWKIRLGDLAKWVASFSASAVCVCIQVFQSSSSSNICFLHTSPSLSDKGCGCYSRTLRILCLRGYWAYQPYRWGYTFNVLWWNYLFIFAFIVARVCCLRLSLIVPVLYYYHTYLLTTTTTTYYYTHSTYYSLLLLLLYLRSVGVDRWQQESQPAASRLPAAGVFF